SLDRDGVRGRPCLLQPPELLALLLHDAGELLDARDKPADVGWLALAESLPCGSRARRGIRLLVGELLEHRREQLERLLEPLEPVLGHAPARLADVGLRRALLRGSPLLVAGLVGRLSELLADVLE